MNINRLKQTEMDRHRFFFYRNKREQTETRRIGQGGGAEKDPQKITCD